jgi:hypothetical protein
MNESDRYEIYLLKAKIEKLENWIRNFEYMQMMKKKEQDEEKIFGTNKPK